MNSTIMLFYNVLSLHFNSLRFANYLITPIIQNEEHYCNLWPRVLVLLICLFFLRENCEKLSQHLREEKLLVHVWNH